MTKENDILEEELRSKDEEHIQLKAKKQEL